MYKVSEVAEMLSVEKVKIFEALIVHDDILEPFTTKERHLTYISEVGVRKLEQLLFGHKADLDEPEVEEEIGYEEHVLHDDHLDQFIKKNESKKSELRNEIIDLKRNINILDKELRMKDDAIVHYQEIINEDVKWIRNMEAKVDILRSKKVDEFEEKPGFFSKRRR